MLTIREKLPIKKMVLFGSTAILVGFAGTYTMLREFFPYDSRDNLADVNWERKQAASGSVIKPAADPSDGSSTDTSQGVLKDSGMVVSETPSAAQPSPNVRIPIASSSNSGPITATPSVTPAPTTVEPTDVTPAPQPEPQPVADLTPVADEQSIVPGAPLTEGATENSTTVKMQP